MKLPNFGWCRFHVLTTGLLHSKTFHIIGRDRCGCLVHNNGNISGCIFRATSAAGRLDGTQCNGVGFFIKTCSVDGVEFAVMMVMMVIARTALLRFDIISLETRTGRRRFTILQRLMLDAAQIWNASFDLCQHVRQWVSMSSSMPRFVMFIVLFDACVASVSAEFI